MSRTDIPFSRPWLSDKQHRYISDVLTSGHTGAGGAFTRRCEEWLEHDTGSPRVLLTASCTNALELSAVLAGIGPGDEIIMPSFTFTSTANAFVLRGAVPVFIDIRPDTLNIDETQIEAAITERTRAIVPVHYAGVACEMDHILAIAKKHGLLVIEDAAQAVGATYKDRPLGSLGDLGCYSFHATKNISCGEGGALLINNPEMIERAEILHDKGTTRSQYRAGKVRQYEWVDAGMSAPPSELQAACLLAQLESADFITQSRIEVWQKYKTALNFLNPRLVSLPSPPTDCGHNAHIFALIFQSAQQRDAAQSLLNSAAVQATLHYRPLHTSPAGLKAGRKHGTLAVASSLPDRLLRLPIWPQLPESTVSLVAENLAQLLG